jgi:hypothetical protein
MNTLKRMIEAIFGVTIQRVQRGNLPLVEEIPQSLVIPSATYAPWLADTHFQAIYSVAREYSLVDEYRMYELFSLAKQASRLGGDSLRSVSGVAEPVQFCSLP